MIDTLYLDIYVLLSFYVDITVLRLVNRRLYNTFEDPVLKEIINSYKKQFIDRYFLVDEYTNIKFFIECRKTRRYYAIISKLNNIELFNRYYLTTLCIDYLPESISSNIFDQVNLKLISYNQLNSDKKAKIFKDKYFDLIDYKNMNEKLVQIPQLKKSILNKVRTNRFDDLRKTFEDYRKSITREIPIIVVKCIQKLEFTRNQTFQFLNKFPSRKEYGFSVISDIFLTQTQEDKIKEKFDEIMKTVELKNKLFHNLIEIPLMKDLKKSLAELKNNRYSSSDFSTQELYRNYATYKKIEQYDYHISQSTIESFMKSDNFEDIDEEQLKIFSEIIIPNYSNLKERANKIIETKYKNVNNQMKEEYLVSILIYKEIISKMHYYLTETQYNHFSYNKFIMLCDYNKRIQSIFIDKLNLNIDKNYLKYSIYNKSNSSLQQYIFTLLVYLKTSYVDKNLYYTKLIDLFEDLSFNEFTYLETKYSYSTFPELLVVYLEKYFQNLSYKEIDVHHINTSLGEIIFVKNNLSLASYLFKNKYIKAILKLSYIEEVLENVSLEKLRKGIEIIEQLYETQYEHKTILSKLRKKVNKILETMKEMYE